MTERHTAVYIRTSTHRQDLRSQRAELERWVAAYASAEPVRWYADQESGSTMRRSGWQQLEAQLRAGAVARIVIWRLDRLGRTSSGLTSLFDELRRLNIPLVSMREGFDLATPAGAMVATILGSVAQYETEVRRERQAAGIAAAKAQGKRWGGRAKGERTKVTPELERQIVRMAGDGEAVAAIARVTQLSRPTVYSVLAGGRRTSEARRQHLPGGGRGRRPRPPENPTPVASGARARVSSSEGDPPEPRTPDRAQAGDR